MKQLSCHPTPQKPPPAPPPKAGDLRKVCCHEYYNSMDIIRAGGLLCRKPAKVMHDGKYYCGIHDPVKRAAKQEKRREEWRAAHAAEAADRARQRAVEFFRMDCAAAIRKIAEGCADPQAEALAVMLKHKDVS